MSKQYKYGDCIPESIKEYDRLKALGKNPKVVEGWVEIDNPELLPDEEFLERYFPDEIKKLENICYSEYPFVSQHT